jgi:hypothetical protein
MNYSSSLSSFVCIVSAGFVGAAGAQTLPGTPADTPSFASSTLVAPVPPQRSAQAAAASAAADPAAAASAPADAAAPFTRPAARPDARARSALRRPLVPTRPHRTQVADAPADDVWRSDTVYASPYEKSPYGAPGDPD